MKRSKIKATQIKTIDTRGQMHRDLTCRNYSYRAESLNEKERSVEAVIATEQPVEVFDMRSWSPVREILLTAGAQLPDKVPFLDSHDRGLLAAQIGSTVDLRVEGDKIVAKNIFANTPEGQRAWTLTQEGHLNTNSIGYRILKGGAITIEPGKSRTVRGVLYTADDDMPLRITTKYQIIENSAVIIPADDQATNRTDNNAEKIIHSTEHWRKKIMFEKWLKERGIDPESLSEAQRSALAADFELMGEKVDKTSETKPAAVTAADRIAADKKVAEAAVAAEIDRQKQIRDLAGADISGEILQRCLEDQQCSVEDAQGIFLKEVRANKSPLGSPAIITNSRAAVAEDLECAMLLRAGCDDEFLIEQYDEQRCETADKFRDLSMTDLAVRSLQLEGLQVPHGREAVIRAAFSSSTLPQLLGAVANKAALRGYNLASATWRKWCSVGSVNDFKLQTRVRMTDTGSLELVGNSGAVKHGTAQEEYETFKIGTYAKQFGVTRQDIINDDLGAFTRTPQAMGNRAGQTVANLVYTHLLANGAMVDDSVALFHADHNNLNTSTALAKTGLATALKAFRKQTDKDEQPIDVEPAYLLVPPELEITAREFYTAPLLVATGTGNSAARAPAKNVFAGMLEPVIESRLSNTTYTGYSTTTWYVTGRPGDVDTIEVSFLNGKQAPSVERYNAAPNGLGVIFLVYIDVGVKALDFRGMQKNTA